MSKRMSSVYKFGILSSSKAFRNFCIFEVTPDNLKKGEVFKIIKIIKFSALPVYPINNTVFLYKLGATL